MLVSIASGKGGTGKTTLALLLAAAHNDATLVDCDVEEPNCHLFLKPKWQDGGRHVRVMVPQVKADTCIGCGDCISACRFNAVAVAAGKALVFDELCHSCGGCILACKHGAIIEDTKLIGTVTAGISDVFPGVRLVSGTLHIGVPSAVPLIRNIKKIARRLTGDVILDCPPGTSCSMVAAVKDSDFCILVTEPNPFGKHDLELAMNVVRFLNIPSGVVINKSDGGLEDESVEELCRKNGVKIMAKIPHSQSFAREYASGIVSDEFKDVANRIWRQLTEKKGGIA